MTLLFFNERSVQMELEIICIPMLHARQDVDGAKEFQRFEFQEGKIILLTCCYYHGGTRLNAMKSFFCLCSL